MQMFARRWNAASPSTLIYNREVLDQVAVPEEQLKAEYEKEKDRYMKPEKVTVVDVYLLKDEGKASQKKAKELLKKIKADPNKDPWKLVLDGTFMVRNISGAQRQGKSAV